MTWLKGLPPRHGYYLVTWLRGPDRLPTVSEAWFNDMKWWYRRGYLGESNGGSSGPLPGTVVSYMELPEPSEWPLTTCPTIFSHPSQQTVDDVIRSDGWDYDWFLEFDGEEFHIVHETWSRFLDEPADCSSEIMGSGSTVLEACLKAVAKNAKGQ